MQKIRISEAEARRALAHFGLGTGVAAVRPIIGGQENQSFRVTHETGDYVVTFCVAKPREEVGANGRLLEVLAEHGYPTSRVVRTVAGELTGTSGGYVTMLKHYIAGECPGSRTRASARAVGVLLGRLHEITPPPGTTVGHPYGLDHFATIAETEEWEPFSSWLRGRREFLEASLAQCSDRTLIHGDPFPDNMIVSGEAHSVIDFEEACLDWAGIDLGVALVGFSLLPRGESGWVDALLSGYGGVRECADIGRLATFAEYAATATAFWRFRQYEVRKCEVATSSDYREMVELANRIHSDGLTALSR